MVKEYELRGLGCANCAAKIEKSIQKQEGILSASVNFMSTLLQVEFHQQYNDNMKKNIEKIVHQYEPDIVVLEKENGAKEPLDHAEHEGRKQLVKMGAGAAVLGMGLVLQHLIDTDTNIVLFIYLCSYLILGGDVVLHAIQNITRGKVFDENFLMGLATIGAFAIGEYTEAVAVMLFYQVGEYFQEAAVRRSKQSITDLMDIRPDYANVMRDNEIVKTAPDAVHVGDRIMVKPGEKIPLDGIVVEGESMLDTMALTGESVPRKVRVSDQVLSGCINQSGVLTVEVTKEFGESTVSKIIDLVENASSKKAPAENFITTFSRYYTPTVVISAALLAAVPPLLFQGIWSEWMQRGLIFLVISCPCALVVSIPLGFFGGIGGASKRGILIKGGNYLEALNHLETIVFDKTGTLTKGVFKVTKLIPAIGVTEESLLETAAYAESLSNHPIALSVCKAYGKEIQKSHISDYEEIAGHGISAIVEQKKVLAGNHKLMLSNQINFQESDNTGTRIYIASEKVYMGCIVISDEVKADSHEAIKQLKSKGIQKTVMLTGDNPQIAEAIGKELGIDEVYGGLLPEGKVDQVELLNGRKSSKGKLAFVGDGINDAPVLARADIGIAMGGLGSDAAIEAADIVLMTDEPSKLTEAIDIARFTRKIVWQNIVFALGVKGVFLVMGAFGMANMWEAVFADVGVSVLAILNAMRVMRR